MKKKGKFLIIIPLAVVITLAGVLGGAYLLTSESRKNFPSDGYVLEITSDEKEQSVAGITFSVGTQYRGKFPNSYIFRDVQGEKYVVDAANYIHYSDGSLSAFTDGMAVNMDDVGKGFLDFYRVGKGMVMEKNETGWQIENNNSELDFTELLWELTENKVLTASEELTLELSGRESEKISGYLEITWVDKGIVQVAGEDMVCQTVTTGGRVIFRSGSVLNLEDRTVTGKDGTVLFSLDDLMADMANGGIVIQSDSASEWQPPELNIETEDGKSGDNGEGGEGGESGTTGGSGTEGTSGEAGEDGKGGDPGTTGKQGETGAAGGSPGSGSGSGSSASATGTDSRLGTIRVSNLEYDCSSVSVSFATEDEWNSLISYTGTVELRDTETNKLIASQNNVNLSYDGMESDRTITFTDCLQPDHQYTIVVKNDYEVEQQNGEKTTGTKTFVTRHFYTSSEGIVMEMGIVSEDTVTVNLNELDFASLLSSGAESFHLRITCDGVTIDWPGEDQAESISDYTENGYSIELVLSDLLDAATNGLSDYNGRTEWESDIPYTIELYTSTLGENDGAWEQDENGDFKGLGTTVRKSTQVLTGRTLKKQPDIPLTGSINAALRDSYYELSVNVESDPDAAVKNYQFVIQDPTGKEVAVLDSTTNVVNWYYGEGLLTGDYTISAKVTYYDNEKDNIIERSEKISVNSAGNASIVFRPYTAQEQTDGSYQWVDSYNMTTTHAGGSDDPNKGVTDGSSPIAVTSNSIYGDLVVNPNGRNFRAGSTVTITITAGSTGNDVYAYKKEIKQTAPEIGYDGNYHFSIKCLGLKADTLYTISVSGTVVKSYTAGSSSSQQESTGTLGSAAVKTESVKFPGSGENTSVAAFRLGDARGATSNSSDIVSIALYTGDDYKGINSDDPQSAYYKERAAARAIAFDVYQGQNKICTIVKDLYESTYTSDEADGISYASVVAGDTMFENTDHTSKSEEIFFKGPVLSNYFKGYSAYLTEEDFRAVGVDTSTIRGEITVRAVALYDYSYGLMNNLAVYEDHFPDPTVTNYNSVPLKELEVMKGSTQSVDYLLNTVTIDMGVRAPSLFNPGYEAISVTELKNAGNGVLSTDPALLSDTTVGLRVASNYPNDDGQTQTITYYCMTMDGYEDYMRNKNSDSACAADLDIIQSYTEGRELAKKNVLFSVKVQAGSAGNSLDGEKVPPLYVMMADKDDTDENGKNLLNQCRSSGSDGNYTYHTASDSGLAIFYTDLIERGHCYVFAFTLESMYGVDVTTVDDPQPWIFPYEIDQHTTSQYFGDLQRSEGIEVFKETPRLATYLDYTTLEKQGKDADTAVWKYIIYDPDNALQTKLPTENNPQSLATDIKTYAGTAENIRKQITNDNEALDNALTGISLLDTRIDGGIKRYTIAELEEKMEKDSTTNIAKDPELAAVITQEFGLNDVSVLEDDRVLSFTLVIEDTGTTPWSGFTNLGYEIWLGVREFIDTYTATGAVVNGAYNKFLDNSLDKNANALQREHFAVISATHRFDEGIAEDTIKGFGTGRLQVSASIMEGGDSLQLSTTGTLSTTLNRLIGFYYMFAKLENGSDGKPNTTDQEIQESAIVQCGFVPYDTSGITSIILDEPSTYDYVALRLMAVYDTGIAGLNDVLVKSAVHQPKPTDPKTPGNGDINYYYAIQRQDSSLYATGTTSVNYTLTYPGTAGTGASGSLFSVTNEDDINTADAATRATFCRGYRAVLYSTVNNQYARLRYRYGAGGAYVISDVSATQKPVLKALAEVQVSVRPEAGTEAYTDGDTTTVWFEVPPVSPTVTATTGTTSGFYSTSETLTFSTKSIETLTSGYTSWDNTSGLEEGRYQNRIYLELYDSNDTEHPLTNTENRYFDTEHTGDLGSVTTKFDDVERAAYFIPSESVTRYSIQVKNLTDENIRRYTVKMYCYRWNGKQWEKVYVKNNIPNSAGYGEGYTSNFTTSQTLNVGKSTSESSLAFTAEYQQTDYASRRIYTEFSLSNTRDYYLQFQVKPETEGDTISLDNDKLMKALGYEKSENEVFWYYDEGRSKAGESGWTSLTYPAYYYESKDTGEKKYFQNTYSFRDSFTFQPDNSVIISMQGKRYRLEVHAYSLYEKGKELEYRQNNDVLPQSQSAPWVSFNVPEITSPIVSPSVRYISEDTSATATLVLKVDDPSYIIGAQKGDEDVPGNYKVVLIKYENGAATEGKEIFKYGEESTEVTIAPSLNSNGMFTAGTTYSLQYSVKNGERYRLMIFGTDESGNYIKKGEGIWYDSDAEGNEVMKANLSVSNLERPQLGEPAFTFNKAAGTFTVKVQKGSNLGEIDQVALTLYNMSPATPDTASVTKNASFGAQNTKGWSDMELDLNELIGELINQLSDDSLEDANLVLVVQYMHEGTYLTESRFSFVYA